MCESTKHRGSHRPFGQRSSGSILFAWAVIKGDGTAASSEATGEKTTITAWAWDPAYNIVALNEAKAIYEAAHEDVTIEVVEMAKADMTKTSTGWAEFVGAFNSGDVAGSMTGCWITPSVMTVPEQSGLWKIAQPPRMDNIADFVNTSNLGGSSFFVLNGTGTCRC